MPKTLTIQAFTYDELGDKAKETARAWWLESSAGDDPGVKEAMAQTLGDAGMNDLKLYWSLNNCQGDGVAFEGGLDVDDFLRTQENLQYQIAHQKWRYQHLIDPEHVNPAVVVGVKATTGIDYIRDAAGEATKNEKGGYNSFVFIRPYEDGALVTAMEDLATHQPRKIRITQESDAHPDAVERFKELALDSVTLAFIKMLIEWGVTLAIKVTHRGRYYHWNSMEVSVEATDYGPAIEAIDDATTRNLKIEEIDNQAISIQEGLRQFVKDISQQLEKEGNDIIEASQEEEAVADNIRANEYLFTQAGSRRYVLN